MTREHGNDVGVREEIPQAIETLPPPTKNTPYKGGRTKVSLRMDTYTAVHMASAQVITSLITTTGIKHVTTYWYAAHALEKIKKNKSRARATSASRASASEAWPVATHLQLERFRLSNASKGGRQGNLRRRLSHGDDMDDSCHHSLPEFHLRGASTT